MRRACRYAAVALAVTVFWAPSTAAQAPAGDSVTGGLIDPFETGIIVNVDAHSGPAGEDPTGTLGMHIGGGFGPTWNLAVTCLGVDGNRAIVGFSGTETFIEGVQPVAGLARAVDGGGPQSGQDSFEWAEIAGPEGDPPIPGPTDCSSYPANFTPAAGPASNGTNGDIVITDTLPQPSSKDQCKNGGWRHFPGFKNQGDCVSFVATGGNNQPAG